MGDGFQRLPWSRQSKSNAIVVWLPWCYFPGGIVIISFPPLVFSFLAVRGWNYNGTQPRMKHLVWLEWHGGMPDGDGHWSRGHERRHVKPLEKGG